MWLQVKIYIHNYAGVGDNTMFYHTQDDNKPVTPEPAPLVVHRQGVRFNFRVPQVFRFCRHAALLYICHLFFP